MTPARWQRLIIALIFVAFAHAVLDVVGTYLSGGIGASVRPVGPSSYRVYAVPKPETFSPRVHVGDTLTLATTSLPARLRFDVGHVGDRIVMTRGDGQRIVATIVYYLPALDDNFFDYVCLLMLAIAMLVVVRRGESIEARTLATFLAFFAFSDTERSWPFLPDWMYLANIYAGRVSIYLALMQGVRLATVFPDPNAGGFRAIVRRWNCFVTIGVVIVDCCFTTLAVVLQRPVPFELAFNRAVASSYVVAIAVCFWIANVRATGAQIGRVRWVSFSIGVGLSGLLADIVLDSVGLRTAWLGSFLLYTTIVIPVALAYAVLRKRVIDVGFVITRAAVFSIVSVILLTVFLGVEWFLGKIFTERSQATSVSVELFVALGLGVALRSIHGRVERVAGRVFFRSRNQAEQALRQFSHDVLYITDQRTIYERTVSMVRDHAVATDAAFYVFEEARYARMVVSSGFPSEVEENDPLFVRLRSMRRTIADHVPGSAVDTELACPLTVRGRIVGALVCSAKRDGEAYAPDEVAILSDVARAAGVAIDELGTEKLRRERDEALAANAALRSLVRSSAPQAGSAEPGPSSI